MRSLYIEAGDHLGLVFGDDDEFDAGTLAFAERGLREGARVLVFSAPGREGSLERLLERSGVDSCRTPGEWRVRVQDARRSLMPDGRFSPRRIRAMYEEIAGRSVADGFSGVWVSVDMSWAVPGGVDAEGLIAFEAELNTLFGSGRLTMICQYDTRLLPEAEITRAIQAHPCTPRGARLRHQPAAGGRGVAFSGETDRSNCGAWAALTASLPDEDGWRIDITGMSFLDGRGMAQLGRVAAEGSHGLTIVATPSQIRRLRLVRVDQVAELVSMEKSPGH
ncbi:MEDS domain-containing protein [Sphaerisporangium sp. NPDC088356]|uniref:MEDS domain-containing protein n=1 Tax=Sphaerisporangium sp. NPDC088356 TaxID=3154871 RepID=UPI00342A1574